MIYAIPNSRNGVANHFMKAKQFVFFDENNVFIDRAINPGSETNTNRSCRDKKSTISLLRKMETDVVIVRNIGERALDKLLKQNVRVFQVNGQTQLSDAIKSPMVELTESTQGRPSKNHQNQSQCSGHSSEHCAHHENCSGDNQHGSIQNRQGVANKKFTFHKINSISLMK